MFWRLAMLALVSSSSVSARADTDMFHVTAAEKAACSADAVRFCSAAYPDEMKLVGCMKQNRAQLSQICRVTFDAGMKRRHL